MDYYIASTIPFDQIDEQLQLSPLPYQAARLNQLEEIIFAPPAPSDLMNLVVGKDLPSGPPPVEQHAPRLGGSQGEKNTSDSSRKRKINHRDVERQRRQEMASLYRSLRSHLPLELLKGKRSVSDHVHQAVGYIKDLQNKIQVLSDRRDGLKRMSHSKSTDDDPQTDKEEHPRTCPLDIVIRIERCTDGAEIVVSMNSRPGVALSKVLGFLVQEGINVISCTSTRVNERLLHSIKSEVISENSSSRDNMHKLKKKLMNLLR